MFKNALLDKRVTYSVAKLVYSHGSLAILNKQGASIGLHSILLTFLQSIVAALLSDLITSSDEEILIFCNAFPVGLFWTRLILYSASLPDGPYQLSH